MYLGLDLGTSGVKALLIDEDQRIIAQASGGLRVSRPRADLVRAGSRGMDPAADEAIGILKAGHGQALAAVRGIGLSGQMHGATLLDADDTVLRPVHPVERQPRPCRGGRARRRIRTSAEITGNIAMPGFTAPKLLWVRTHEPRPLRRERAKVLLPKDYRPPLADGRACRRHVGRRRHLLARRGPARDWSPELLAALGLDERTCRGSWREPSRPDACGRSSPRRWGMAAARRHRRRGGRQRGIRLRDGRGAAGRGLPLARHVRGAVRRQCRASAQPRERGPRLLPRLAGDLASDGRYPVGDRCLNWLAELTGTAPRRSPAASATRSRRPGR